MVLSQGRIEREEYAHHAKNHAKRYDNLNKFLIILKKITIKIYAKVRLILKKENASFSYKILRKFIFSRVPKIDNEAINKEIEKIKNELKESEKKSKEEIDAIEEEND